MLPSRSYVFIATFLNSGGFAVEQEKEILPQEERSTLRFLDLYKMQLPWNDRCTVRKKAYLGFYFAVFRTAHLEDEILQAKGKPENCTSEEIKAKMTYLLTASVTLCDFSDLKFPNSVWISKKTKNKNKNWRAENTNWSPIAPQWTCSSRRNRPTISFAWWPWSFF